MNRIYKSDIHVHSKYSNKPTIWALKKINCPESYTSPEFIYKSAQKMGMDYVTITDHNTIQGALEIAHLPGVFISTEATTYFPEDGCKLHIVILDINEEIFRDVMRLRANVYNLVAYLQKNNIAHFIAHPLYDNSKLSVETVEKILLLFDVFEVKNGSRTRQFNRLITNILHSLTRDKLESLANRLIYIYTDRLTRMSFSMGITSLIHSLITMGLIHFFVSPYYIAFHQQHRSKKRMNELENIFLPGNRAEKKQKIALFTDTLHEINGVAIAIKRLIETAKNQGVELVVITSSSEKTVFENGVMNFKAVGDFALPEYAELKLHFPPILDVIDYFEKDGMPF